jgi:hypothetical protein
VGAGHAQHPVIAWPSATSTTFARPRAGGGAPPVDQAIVAGAAQEPIAAGLAVDEVAAGAVGEELAAAAVVAPVTAVDQIVAAGAVDAGAGRPVRAELIGAGAADEPLAGAEGDHEVDAVGTPTRRSPGAVATWVLPPTSAPGSSRITRAARRSLAAGAPARPSAAGTIGAAQTATASAPSTARDPRGKPNSTISAS